MNLILLSESDFVNNDENRVQLHGRRCQYIRTIHKAQKGDVLKVGLINGNLGSGIVNKITDTVLEMTVTLTEPPSPPLPVTLILALPRPKTVRKVLQSATAMGVKRIIFIKTWRVEKNYWQSPVLNKESIREQCLLGLEQARDTVMPAIELKHFFKPFVEDEIPDIIQGTLALVSHPTAEEQLPRNITDTYVSLAIGPEGGFIDYEINMLVNQGFEPVTFGKRIQRVEYAIPAILGRLF